MKIIPALVLTSIISWVNPILPASSTSTGPISAGQEMAVLEKNAPNPPAPNPLNPKKIEVWVTAYSSTPEETDDDPFITASGKKVKEGIVAANFLPFGTKIKIPEIFGEKILIVEDRMHRRKTNFVDIWLPSQELAIKFGIKRATIDILE
jgi:3D (Asp-Asp-Asp) domain-containing protein